MIQLPMPMSIEGIDISLTKFKAGARLTAFVKGVSKEALMPHAGLPSGFGIWES